MLRPWFIAHFDQNVLFPISISYISCVSLKNQWLNQPFLAKNGWKWLKKSEFCILRTNDSPDMADPSIFSEKPHF